MPKVIFDPGYGSYDLGPEHPFSPLRVEMMLDLLAALGIDFEPVRPQPLTPDELLEVHDAAYVAAVEAASCGEAPSDAESYGLGTADNPVVAGMASAARLIAGGTVCGARMIADGEADVVLQLGGGFHHARRALASGFCLYNDLALAIRLLTSRGLSVAYLDIDVHHGDGVQELLYGDEHVLTLSIHESGEYLFPGTGWVHELGQGMGRGLKLNLPLEPFTEGPSYLEALRTVGRAAFEFFRPDVVVIQAGADAHYLDPLADLMLTTRDYEKVYRTALDLARTCGTGRALFTLGGGYSLTATPRVWAILYLVLHDIALPDELPAAWCERWQERLGVEVPRHLQDPENAFDPIPRRPEIERHNHNLVQRLLDAVAPNWW
jgi:acetoin utilization protein AcuC